MNIWEIAGIIVQLLGNLLSVVLVLAILSGRKEARATLGWVLLVLFLPYLGALLYLVFGRTPVHFPSRRKIEEPASCPLPPRGLNQGMERTAKLTASEPVPCHELDLLPGAEDKYRRLEADIAAAERRVVLCYYVFRRDATGRRLLDLLADKAQQGVQVCFLYDGWGAFGLAVGGYLNGYRKRGVRAVAFHPVADPLQMSRLNYRNHRKIAVIDGEIAYTGSTNVGDEYLGLHHRFGPWKDLHVRLKGGAARALEQVFIEDWWIATGDDLQPSPPPEDPGSAWVHVIPSGPIQGGENIFPLLFAQLASATRSIDILTPYLIPDYGLVAALRIAARQGVQVRILVPGRSNHPMVAAAGRSYYDDLLEAGVELFETREGMLHAKSVLVDGAWAMVGSTNLDNRSFHINFEINLATAEPAFCRALENLFETWLTDAETVLREDLAARSLTRRLLEGACRTLSPVL